MKSIIIISICTAIAIAFSNIASAKKFKTKKELCSYLADKKDQAEERMREGYTVKQYNKLEAKRKYWKKKYIESCF